MKTKFLLSLVSAAAGAAFALTANAQMGGGSYPSNSSGAAPDASAAAPSAAFSKLDTNKDGYISKAEAKKDKELSKSFDSLDANHDGKLDPAEFAAYGGAGSSMGGGAKP
jgi:hypothetical protein